MTVRQRESAAKYCYDLSKIVMTVAVVTNAFSQAFWAVNFWLGLLFGVALYLIGYLLDGQEEARP
jgi:hypothetical protein